MKSKILLILIVSTLSFSFAQKERFMDLKPFTKIRVADKIKARIKQSDKNRITIRVAKNDADVIMYEVQNSQLRVYTVGIFNELEAEVLIEFNSELTDIIPTYGAKIVSDSTITSKKLKIDGSLDGLVQLNLDVENLTVDAGQGSDLYIEGKCEKAKIEVHTGGKINAKNLNVENAEVKAATGAKIWITANVNFIAKAYSGGKIYFKSKPTDSFEKLEVLGGQVILE